MRRLVRVLVIAICCLVISLPAWAKETQVGKAGGQRKGKGQQKTAKIHGGSAQKGSVKKANKGQKEKTQKQSTKKKRSAKKTTGKSHSSQPKQAAPKSTYKAPSTRNEG